MFLVLASFKSWNTPCKCPHVEREVVSLSSVLKRKCARHSIHPMYTALCFSLSLFCSAYDTIMSCIQTYSLTYNLRHILCLDGYKYMAMNFQYNSIFYIRLLVRMYIYIYIMYAIILAYHYTWGLAKPEFSVLLVKTSYARDMMRWETNKEMCPNEKYQSCDEHLKYHARANASPVAYLSQWVHVARF